MEIKIVPRESSDAPTITVVICCFNSANRLPRTFLALASAELKTVGEIILVNNASSDNTVVIARKFADSIPVAVRIIDEQRAGLSFARCAGVSAARYPFICFLDDDNEVVFDWFSRVSRTFVADDRIGAIGARTLPPNLENLPGWFHSVAGAYAVGPQALGDQILPYGSLVFGAGLSMRSQIAKRFYSVSHQRILIGRQGSKVMSGEDSELCYFVISLKMLIYYSDSPSLRHNIDPKRISKFHAVDLFFSFGRADYYLTPVRERLRIGFLGRGAYSKIPGSYLIYSVGGFIKSLSIFLCSPSFKSFCNLIRRIGFIAAAIGC